jgi:hypothetical protein
MRGISRSRKLLAGGVIAAGALAVASQAVSGPLPGPSLAPASPQAVEGCIASTPGNNTPYPAPSGSGFVTRDGSCTFQAFGRGGYAAGGSWSIRVVHASGITATYSSTNHDPSCQVNVIGEGDTVFASTGISGGFVAVSSPAPSNTPSLAGQVACPA